MPTLREWVRANHPTEAGTGEHPNALAELNAPDPVEPTTPIPLSLATLRLFLAQNGRRRKLDRASQDADDTISSVALVIIDILQAGGDFTLDLTTVAALIQVLENSTHFDATDTAALTAVTSRPQTFVEKHYGLEGITPQKLGRIMSGGNPDIAEIV